MQSKHFLKDKKISIYEYISTVDEIGDTVEAWEPIAQDIWAYYRQASANEFFAAATTQYKVEAIFTISYRSNIDNTMRIVFREQEYEITRIDDFEGYKGDLQIYAYTTGKKLIL